MTSSALDPSQQAVVDLADDVTVAVIGAPGSGKTRTLVELVADRIMVRGYRPSEVVVLTSTRLAATRLRDRLALRIGVPTNGPLARTVNSLAFQIVQTEAVAAGAPAPTLLTGAEHDRIIAEILAGHLADGTGPVWPDPLTADVRALRGFRTELRELMMRATEDGVSPDELSALGRQHDVPEWVAAGRFAAEYGSVVAGLDDAHLDSAELIAAARLAVVRGGAAALTGVRLVVVDDFQELAAGAVNFLSTLARRGVAVIAFGDPDVATTSFRGAEKDGLGRLGSVLAVPVAEPLYLSTVYRHATGIRSLIDRATARIGAAAAGRQRAARAVGGAEAGVARAGAAEPGGQTTGEGERAVQGEPGAAGVDRGASGVEPGAVRVEFGAAGVELGAAGVEPVRRLYATSAAAEVAQIAQVLREHHLLRGVPWSAMAVVVRSGALLSSVSRGLALAEVPTSSVTGGLALRDDYAARQLITTVLIATGALELTDDRLTDLLLGPFGGLDAVSLRRLRLALRQEELAGDGNRSADDLLREAIADPGRLATIGSAPARRVARLAANLHSVRGLAEQGASAEELLWQLFSASGLGPAWFEQSQGTGILADEANRNLDGVVGVFTAAKRFVERTPNRPAADFFVGVLEAEVAEDSLSPRSASDAVVVSTPNGVIGAEFEVVVIARLQESVWPNLRLRGSLLHPDRLSDVVAARPSRDIDERAEVLGDELRMFVLAASRARTQVVLSAVFNDDEQPSPFTRLVLPVPGAPGGGGTGGAAAVSETSAATYTGAGDAGFGDGTTVSDTPPAASAGTGTYTGIPAGHSTDSRRREDVPGAVYDTSAHPLSLRALVGVLRRRLVETGDPSAASALARLAAEGVPGAHPQSWYGLLEPSTLDDLVDLTDPEATVDVSPSKLDTFEKSPLAWFIERVSGGTSGLPANIGTLLHSVMEEVSKEQQPDLSEAGLWQRLDARWGELRFESPWLGERERLRTEDKIKGLSEYLRDFERSGAELLGGEESFVLEVGPARLRGTVDRVERGPDGLVSVVDLKTGKSAPAARELERHAQLGSYQLALTGSLVGRGAVEAVATPGAAQGVAGVAVDAELAAMEGDAADAIGDPADAVSGAADTVTGAADADTGATGAVGEAPAGVGDAAAVVADDEAENLALAEAATSLPEVVADAVQSAGALLLYVSGSQGSGSKKRQYRLLLQAPLTEEAEAAFRERITTAATGMAGSVFPGREGLDEFDPHGRWTYRIHLVKAVSA
ncbi:ATP-dependent DNA helicase [Subtercola sp. YIM 133946]|uniref:ATP-dependent DNA helicase n=1 Tax=Subtercola sp. YIM 133946 TaxID=3118909 RepID=UPI002F9221EF